MTPAEGEALLGGSEAVYWMIEHDGRTKAANAVVGHATIVKGVGSASGSAGRATVVPVWGADNKAPAYVFTISRTIGLLPSYLPRLNDVGRCCRGDFGAEMALTKRLPLAVLNPRVL